MTAHTTTLSRVAVVLTIAVLTVLLLLSAAVQAGGSGREVGTHVVGQGDTLWGIAAEYTAPGGDVRHTLYDIRNLNRLDSSIISIGQRLVVPAD